MDQNHVQKEESKSTGIKRTPIKKRNCRERDLAVSRPRLGNTVKYYLQLSEVEWGKVT